MLRRDVRVLVFGAGVAALGMAMSDALARLAVRAERSPRGAAAGRGSAAGAVPRPGLADGPGPARGC
jgi:hypothetical protein